MPSIVIDTLVGEIKMWGGSSAPSGYLQCNGAAISRTTYSALFNVIGTNYGVGDGSTTFNLPNFMSRVVVGMGTGPGLSPRTLGETGGFQEVTLSEAQLAIHHHDGVVTGGNFVNVSPGSGLNVVSGLSIGSSANTGVSQSIENMQPFGVANFIIKF